MLSSQHPQQSAGRPVGGAPGPGTPQDLIARVLRLRAEIGAARSAEPEEAADSRMRRAVLGLAGRQLDDAAEQLAGLLPAPAPLPAGQARLGGRVGSAEWSLLTDEVTWTEELFAIFGRPVADGPLTLDELPSCVLAEDQPGLAGAVTRCLIDGHPVDCEFRIRRPDAAVRTLQLAAEPVLDDDGGTVAMWAMIRDAGGPRTVPAQGAGPRPDGVGGPAALRERQRLARTEHRLALELQEAATAPWLSPPRRDPRPGVPRSLEIAACFLPADTGSPVAAKWYDTLELPDGSMLLSMGDLSGRGPAAAAGAATTVGALRGVSLAGATPGTALEHLNELLDCGPQPVLAGLVCGRYRPHTGELTWAQAGHPAPMLCREGTGRPLPRPAGALLGTVGGARYPERTEHLRTGDLLVLATDGLFPGPSAYSAGEGDAGRGCDPRLPALAPALSAAGGARHALDLLVGACDQEGRPDDACVLVARVC